MSLLSTLVREPTAIAKKSIDVSKDYFQSERRDTLHVVLTPENKKHSEEGVKFRNRYTKMRLLTPEEETTAGKFSHVGKRLEGIQSALSVRLGRDPTNEEWACACRLTLEQLILYKDIAARARNRLVQHNLRLVDFFVRHMMSNARKAVKEISYYELVAEGCRGLTKAAENYDGRGKFSPYARFWIQSELSKGISKLRPGSMVPHRTALLNAKVWKVHYQLLKEYKRTPTDEDIAAYLKMRASTIRSIKEDAINGMAISAHNDLSPLGSMESGDGKINTYLDQHLKPEQDQIRDITEIMSWKLHLNEVMRSCLTPQEQRILNIRFGLSDGMSRSVDHTSKLVCMSPEGVRKSLIKSFDKLRSSSSFDSPTFAEGPPRPSIMTVNGRIGVKVY